MAAEERWYFTKEQLANTPNRKCGIDADRELSYRQQAANFIQDMGQRLQVNQLCINTAIVYMHRFYMFHTFSKFHRNAISTCALFLAAKVEEQPRKLEHVIKVAHVCLHRDSPALDTKSEAYLEQAQELVINENIMLQTLGFDVAIDHPHTHVVKCCHLIRGGNSSLHGHHASKDLAQTSYFMATNSLHLTTMCLQYKPTVVACVCIHLACKWVDLAIPTSSEGKKWFYYVDKTVTEELLEELTSEFVAIMDRCPSRLKRKTMNANPSGCNEMAGMGLPDSGSVSSKPGSSSISLTLNSALSSLKGERSSSEKHHERERERATASSKGSHKSQSSSSVSSAEKNGTPNDGVPERKERPKKEHISSNSTGGHVAVTQATSVLTSRSDASQPLTTVVTSSPLTSVPGKPDLVKVASCMDSAQLGDSSNTPLKKTRGDGSSRTMTPKEYHEYKERSKREKEKMKALAEQSRIQAAKQGKSDGGWEKGMIQELTLNNTPLSSLNLQPVVSLTHLNLAKLKQAKHSQLSAGGSSAAAKPFVNVTVDGLNFAASDVASSSTQGFNKITPITRRTPEPDGKEINASAAKLTSVNLPAECGSSHSVLTGFSIDSILTPSPPTTKDGDPFNMDEEMAVFTSPSDLLVPVVPNEPELTLPAVVEPVKMGVSKSEHKKQRKDEQKMNLKNSSPTSFTNIEFKPQLNPALATPELKKREKLNSKVKDTTFDVFADGVESDRRHHSVKNSAEKLIKHHRVKKSQLSSVPAVEDSHHGDESNLLPQPEFHSSISDHTPSAATLSSKLSEVNSDTVRVPIAAHSQLPAELVQQPCQNVISALVTEPTNELKGNFPDKRHSSNLRGNSLPPSIPDDNKISEKIVETQVPLPPPVGVEPDGKHSKRNSQSSSSSSSKHKEKRKKHDKKEKTKEHSREKGEEKIVPKLTIRKDALSASSSAGIATKSEMAGSGEGANYKPKDESLVMKIKLNTSSSGGKSSKNGSLPEVVTVSQQPVQETLVVKESSGLKLKISKNHSSKESYSIGNDDVKPKDKHKPPKESRKRARSSSSPKTRDPIPNRIPGVVQQPPAKSLKTASAKSPKKVAVNINNNNKTLPVTTVASSNSIQASIVNPVTQPPQKTSAPRKLKTEPASVSHQTTIANAAPTMMTNHNNTDYNRRPAVHEREQRRGGKRGRGSMRMGGPLPPPPGPPMAPPQQPMMFQGMNLGIPPMFDRGAAGGDGYAQFFNYGQNNFYNHQMFQEENPMFYNQCGPPMMRHPPPPHPMAFPSAVHQQSRRGGGHHYLRPPVLPPRTSSGPPLPPVPPPANPPLPPDL